MYLLYLWWPSMPAAHLHFLLQPPSLVFFPSQQPTCFPLASQWPAQAHSSSRSYYSNAPGPNPPPPPEIPWPIYIRMASYYHISVSGSLFLPPHPTPFFFHSRVRGWCRKYQVSAVGSCGRCQSVGWGQQGSLLHPAVLEGVRQHPGASQTLSLPNRAPLACPTPSLPPAQ